MDIYIYSDESGVFDYKHNKHFVFAGVICFSKKAKELLSRRYSSVENNIRKAGHYKSDFELKASNIKNYEKHKIYRSLSKSYKFCVIIDQNSLNRNIFENPKHKQRYLDFAYKIVLKKCFELLITNKLVLPLKVEHINVFVDQHTTATDGIYELRENLLNEFKTGTFNFEYDRFFEPIFPRLLDLQVHYVDSKKKLLVRAADIIANHFYYNVVKNKGVVKPEVNTFIYRLPANITVCNGIEYFNSENKN